MIQRLEKTVAAPIDDPHPVPVSVLGRTPVQQGRPFCFATWLTTSANWLYMLWLGVIVVLIGVTIATVYGIVSTAIHG